LVLGLVTAVVVKGSGAITCPFRLLTGIPCPTCGMIRAAGHVLSGELGAAFRTNPLDAATLVVVAPLAGALLLANRIGRWAVRIEVGRIGRVALWSAGVAVLVANWLYVLSSGI